MEKARKQELVADMKQDFATANSAVVFQFSGLLMNENNELRGKARANNALVRVTKNSLAKIAANDTDFAILSEYFSGQTAIITSPDAVLAAKTIQEFAKDNEKITIVGGVVDGNLLDAAGVKQLAATPSLDESRAKLVGLLQAPAQQLASITQAPAGQLARVFGAYGNQ